MKKSTAETIAYAIKKNVSVLLCTIGATVGILQQTNLMNF